jgi:hypothetical protein
MKEGRKQNNKRKVVLFKERVHKGKQKQRILNELRHGG